MPAGVDVAAAVHELPRLDLPQHARADAGRRHDFLDREPGVLPRQCQAPPDDLGVGQIGRFRRRGLVGVGRRARLRRSRRYGGRWHRRHRRIRLARAVYLGLDRGIGPGGGVGGDLGGGAGARRSSRTDTTADAPRDPAADDLVPDEAPAAQHVRLVESDARAVPLVLSPLTAHATPPRFT
nr:hypothetical protein [Catenulispora acidiphila]